MTAKARYEKMRSIRQPYIDRAERMAELTIPFIIPRDGDNEGSSYKTPWQSVGSFGVNSLASKMALTLYPPNEPSFRLIPNRFKLKKENITDDERAMLDNSLSEIEKAAMADFEKMVMRPKLHLALKHLIISGNVLFYAPIGGGDDDDQITVFGLKSYVVRRDMAGNVLEIISEQSVDKDALGEDIISAIENSSEAEEDGVRDGEYRVYTCCKLARKNRKKIWEVYQEVGGIVVPESVGEYPFKSCPFRALRMIAIDGQDYGRSYCEEYAGDLKNAEGLVAAVNQFAAAAAKVVFLVNPNSTIDVDELVKADNGSFVDGSPDDIAALQIEKGADMKVAKEVLDASIQRLQYAFLMTQAIQRDAERVTAEELRLLAKELDSTLGGVYSLLAGDLQLWMANMQIYRMEKRGDIPKLPEGDITPAIVTGISSIGRGNEIQKINAFVQFAGAIGAAGLLKMNNALLRYGNELALDTEGLIKTPEELQAEQQQAMQSNMLEAATPELAKAVGSQMIQQPQGQQVAQ